MSKYKVLPRCSFTEWQYQIWPIDDWSRKILINYCIIQNMRFTEVLTTMGTNALQFTPEDYYKCVNFINNYSFSSD